LGYTSPVYFLGHSPKRARAGDSSKPCILGWEGGPKVGIPHGTSYGVKPFFCFVPNPGFAVRVLT